MGAEAVKQLLQNIDLEKESKELRADSPGSTTTYEAKYNIFSKDLGDISSKRPILLGIPLKYQI